MQPHQPDPTAWWDDIFKYALGIILGFGTLALIYLMAQPFALLILAIAIGVAMLPLVERLCEHMPRQIAVTLVTVGSLLLIAGAGYLVIPAMVDQLESFRDRLPTLAREIEQWLDAIGLIPVEASVRDEFRDMVGGVQSLLRLPLEGFSLVLTLLLVYVISLYWMAEAPRIRRFFLSLFPETEHDEVKRVLARIGEALGGFVQGTLLDMLAVGVLTYIGLLVLGVNYALMLAVLAGVLEIIPRLGPLMASIPIVLVAAIDSPGKALAAAIFVLVLQQIDGHIIIPYVMGSRTQLSPLLVIVALLVGGAIGGLLGVLAAIPVAAVIRVLVSEVVAPAIRRRTQG